MLIWNCNTSNNKAMYPALTRIDLIYYYWLFDTHL